MGVLLFVNFHIPNVNKKKQNDVNFCKQPFLRSFFSFLLVFISIITHFYIKNRKKTIFVYYPTVSQMGFFAA